MVGLCPSRYHTIHHTWKAHWSLDFNPAFSTSTYRAPTQATDPRHPHLPRSVVLRTLRTHGHWRSLSRHRKPRSTGDWRIHPLTAAAKGSSESCDPRNGLAGCLLHLAWEHFRTWMLGCGYQSGGTLYEG